MEVWVEGYHGRKEMKRGGRIYAAISVENAGNKDFERLIVSPEVRKKCFRMTNSEFVRIIFNEKMFLTNSE